MATHIFFFFFVKWNVLGSLYGFLRALNIDPDKKHETFGNVKDFINVTMVKQKYLEVYTDKNQHTYSWGVRSEAEISKHELLQFVADVSIYY